MPLETSAAGADSFTVYSRGDRESWTECAIFAREDVERFVRAECGEWLWIPGEGRQWRDEPRPLEEIEPDLLAEWLTGWAGYRRGPGLPFSHGGYARVSRFRVIVTRHGGLDI